VCPTIDKKPYASRAHAHQWNTHLCFRYVCTYSLSLSLSHTHTHTQTHTHTHTHTQTHNHTLTYTRAHTLTCTRTHTLTYTRTYMHTCTYHIHYQSYMLSLSISHTYTHFVSFSLKTHTCPKPSVCTSPVPPSPLIPRASRFACEYGVCVRACDAF
jgi:hypothetical protein